MKLEISTDTIPNVKRGERLGQKLINRLKMFEEMNSVSGENALKDWDLKLAENLLLGLRHRLNALACAMMIDALNYDRLGIKITGASWGMPAALKVTVAIAWTSPTTATPLSDIWSMDQVARLTYGIEYDTITMSTETFRLMAATTEFAQRASLIGNSYFLLSSAALQTKNDPEMLTFANRVTGKTIVLDDAQFYVKTNDGTEVRTRALPAGKVLLSRSQDERDNSVMDMANGIPTETVVASMIGGAPEGLTESYGPIAYFTGRQDLNPADITCWAVARAFPRKFVPESTAVLSVL